ncbi:hypothetical protein GCM10029963_18180 [Micromonospora andamanensis]
MSNEERPDSLADQAAAWIPPWQRPAPAPAPTDPAPAPTDPAPAPTDPAPVAEGDAADLGAQVPLQGRIPSKIEGVGESAGRRGGDDGETGEEVPGEGFRGRGLRVRGESGQGQGFGRCRSRRRTSTTLSCAARWRRSCWLSTNR